MWDQYTEPEHLYSVVAPLGQPQEIHACHQHFFLYAIPSTSIFAPLQRFPTIV